MDTIYQQGHFFVFESRCPHVGQPLDLAKVERNELTCNWHNMVFKLEDGEIIYDSGFIGIPKLKVFKVKIENDMVWIALEKPAKK